MLLEGMSLPFQQKCVNVKIALENWWLPLLEFYKEQILSCVGMLNSMWLTKIQIQLKIMQNVKSGNNSICSSSDFDYLTEIICTHIANTKRIITYRSRGNRNKDVSDFPPKCR